MDQTYPVKRNLGPHTFKIPYGYFTGCQTPEEVNCYPKMSSLEYAFWLPDLRPPKKDMWYDANFRPKEEGRAPPGPHDYVVKVLGLEFIDTSAGKTETPTMGFSNLLPSDEIIRLDRKFGLLHLLPDNPGKTDLYADFSQINYKILLSCDGSESTVDNPLCKVHLYFLDLQLEVVLLMPVDALPEWQKVKNGLRTLVQQWLVKK